MKLVLSVIMFLGVSGVFGQGHFKTEYDKIIEIPVLNKEEQFAQMKNWLTIHFSDAMSGIEEEDMDAGIIKAKGYSKYQSLPEDKKYHYRDTEGYLIFNISVMLKRGRTKIVISDFRHLAMVFERYSFGPLTKSESYLGERYADLADKWHEAVWSDLKLQASKIASELTDDYTEYMTNSPSSEDDW